MTQHVFRIGWRHNKWLVIIPETLFAGSAVEKALPMIHEILRQTIGDGAIKTFDHVEYLGHAYSLPEKILAAISEEPSDE